MWDRCGYYPLGQWFGMETKPKPLHTGMPAEIRSKFWLFTWNNYNNTPGYRDVLSGFKNVTYMVYGHEVAPVTGTLHLQGYVEFSVRTKLSTLKNLQKEIHWETPKWYNTWEECRAYCIKEGNDIVEWGTGTFDKVLSRKKQATGGKRTDIDDIRDAMTSGAVTNTRELEMFPGLTYQAMLFADRFLRNARPTRECVPDIFWLHGRTGLGKSRFAHEFIDHVELGREWRSWQSYDNRLKWFDGYDKHEIALFDDFRGADCHFPTLLRISDRYVCRVEVKGASAWWCPRIIIFTSSQSLEAGFGHLGSSDRADQFYRRVRDEGAGGEFDFNDPAEIRRFRERIDGYVVPVPSAASSIAPLPSPPQPVNSPGSPQAEEGAQESKSDEEVHDTDVSLLHATGGDVPLSGGGSLDLSFLDHSFTTGFNP